MKTSLPHKSLLTIALLVVLSLGSSAQSPFWDKTAGPYGVSLWSFLVTADGTYYGGSGYGEVYRKLPGEDQWKIVRKAEATILLLFEYEGMIYAGDDGGMLAVSTDNGEHWQTMNSGLNESSSIRTMVVADNGDLFAGTASGIYKRIVGKGSDFSWERSSFTSSYGTYIFSMCKDKNGVLYAGTGRGIYRSNDNGATWILSGLAETANAIFSITASNNGDVYAGTADAGLFINYANDTEADGWISASASIMNGNQIRKITIIDSKVFISITGMGTYYSEDNTNWTLLIAKDSRAGTFYDATTEQLVVSTLNGLWVSPLQDTFTFSQTGLPLDVSHVYSANNSKLIALADRDTRLFESADNGTTWSQVFSNSEGVITCYAEKENEDRFAGCDGGFNGSPWVQAYIYNEFQQKRIWFSLGFPADVKHINDVFITSSDSVFVGTDAGLFYIESKTYEVNRLSKIAAGVNILSLAENTDGHIYAATSDGLYVSTDKGVHWDIHKLDGITINALTLWGKQEGYAATNAGLFYISNLNAEPALVSNGLGGSEFSAVTRDDHGHIYAAGKEGVYYAPDKNTSWTLQTEGVEGFDCRYLHMVDNKIYLSTNVGIYKHKYAEQAEITLSGLGPFTYDGKPHPAIATTNPAGIPVTITYNGLAEAPETGGYYQVAAVINDGAYAGRAKGSITIQKAIAEIRLSGLGTRYYSGNTLAVTATTTPANLPVIITYNNKADLPVEIGEYYVVAVIDHPSYKGEATGDLIVQDPVLGIEDPDNKLMLVYPVPAREQLIIESMQDRIRSVTVSDVMGRTVDTLRFTNPVTTHRLNVTHYATGMLLLYIVTDKGARIVKRAQVIR